MQEDLTTMTAAVYKLRLADVAWSANFNYTKVACLIILTSFGHFDNQNLYYKKLYTNTCKLTALLTV